MKKIVVILLLALSTRQLISQQIFENITSSAGISGTGLTNSVSFNDYNNDGKPDLYIIHESRSELLKNNGNQTFTAVPNAALIPSGQFFQVSVMGDYDNDGDLDIFVAGETSRGGSARQCFLFRNDGNDKFTDVSNASGAGIIARVYSAAWFDFDQDGYLDLFLGGLPGNSNIFLKNLGNGTFANHTQNVKLDGFFANTRGIATGDFDRDGDIDVFVTNTAPTGNYLFRNDGNIFSEIAASLKINFPSEDIHSAEFADYDNDGDLDLFIGNTINGGSLHLLKNDKGTFADVTANSGLNSVYTYGSSFNDFDNDGYLDLLVLQSVLSQRKIALYRNDGNGRFIDATAISGLDTLTLRNTLAVADLDNDGRLDVYIGAYTSDGKDQLYRNIAVARNWLKVKLNGTSSNKAGIGAWLELTANSKKQYRQINAGEGYRSEDDFTQHFGLGAATIVDSLKIEWPSGTVQVVTNITVNQTLTVTESKSLPAAPKNLQATAGDRQITLKWRKNTEADFLRYRIYRGTSPNPNTKVDSTNSIADTTKTFAGLTNGTTYYFRITAVDNNLNESGYSNEVSAIPTGDQFTKITTGVIVNDGGNARGCGWGDYDNDGDLDLLVTNREENNVLYSNNGNGTFNKITQSVIFTDGGNSRGISWGDYDNDGHIDIFIGNHYQNNYLYHNNGNGLFSKITSGPVANDQGIAYNVSWGDYDNDGDLDLFAANCCGQNDFLYSNNGNGTFTKITQGAIVNDGGNSISANWVDYDNDGDLDLFVATGDANVQYNKNFLYTNNGDGTFTKVTQGAIVNDQATSWGSSWGDYDNDGDLDLFVATIYNQNDLLYTNNGNGTFTKVTTGEIVNDGGHSLGSSWGDYDNDGDLDLFVAYAYKNNSLFSNNGDGTFTKITAGVIVNEGGNSGSCAWADYDNDGDLDLFVANAPTQNNFLYSNNGNTNRWINIKCVGTVSNASAIGTKIRVKAQIKGKPVWQLQEISGQTGNLSQNSLNAEFGLGDATQIDSIRIEWPSRIVQVLVNVPANQFLTVVEKKSKPIAPRNLRATASDRRATLTWDANPELDLLRYRIYGGTAPNPTTKIDSVLAALGTTKILTGLTNGTRYYFRITAVDLTLNESGYSNEVSATPSAVNLPPAAPQNLAATAGDRQITLTWTANSEADFLRYRIYGGTTSNPAAIVDSVQGSANTSKTLTGLSNGTTYFYRLTAVDQALNASGFSNEVSATPSATDLPPAPPQNLAATAGVAQITLTWNANTESDFLRYRIYGGTNPNPTAKIDSVEGANSTAITIRNLTVGATYYFRVTAVDQALHVSGYSNTVSAKPLADNAAPTLANAVYSEPADLNSEVTVAIAATDASGIKNVWLYYRVAGAVSFSNRVMTRQADNTFTQAIPAGAITNKGAEFYVRAEDAYANVAQTRLHPVRVYCPNGIANPASQPSGAVASFYRLFSIPLALDDKSPATFLTANLGANDEAKYRWYGLERATQVLREYPNFGNIQITPDMGFALLVNIKNVKLKTSSGTTVATTAPYNISLPAGWSLIGNPFNFNIPFDSLRVSFGTFELWSFEGDWQINTRGLEPWKGYAIWLSDAATFSIRPGVARLNNGTAFYSVENNAAENWLLQIIADNGRHTSRFNFAGQFAGATDNEDALDLHQPVRLADGVEVVFTKKNSANLKADIRQPSSNGHTWEFTCRLNPKDEVLSLTFDGVATVPQAFDIFLLESETATAYNLRANPRLQFATRHLTEKRFQLVAGTKAYLNEQSLPAELHPTSFELLQNFPNPFNPSTQIIYSLPEASHVEVSVYNVRGERVATLVDERQESGSHTVVWNAEKVGTGVYFIKMRTGRVERIKKCLFVK